MTSTKYLRTEPGQVVGGKCQVPIAKSESWVACPAPRGLGVRTWYQRRRPPTAHPHQPTCCCCLCVGRLATTSPAPTWTGQLTGQCRQALSNRRKAEGFFMVFLPLCHPWWWQPPGQLPERGRSSDGGRPEHHHERPSERPLKMMVVATGRQWETRDFTIKLRQMDLNHKSNHKSPQKPLKSSPCQVTSAT